MRSPVPNAYHVETIPERDLEEALNQRLHDNGWAVVAILGQIGGTVKILFAEWAEYRIVR